MSILRVWIFRVLVLASGGLLLYSWLMPWWSFRIYELWTDVAVIRPWGIEIDAPRDYLYLIAGSDMPGWFGPVMWTYLGIVIAALLFSLSARNKGFKLWRIRFRLPSFIIGFVGFSYIVVVVLAVIIAAIRTGDYFDMPLIGDYFIKISESEYSDTSASLLLGYWLACGVGPLLLVLALLRSKIIGMPKLLK